jgi:Ca-activated chloride channel family protein
VGGLSFAVTGFGPLVVGALALAVLGVVTALHLLRTQRRRLLVSWEPLWRAGPGAAEGHRRAGGLRRWGSWALQVAIGWLLLLGAAGLVASRGEGAPRAVVVLVDVSSSMAAGPPGATRLDEARARAGALVAGLSYRDRALVAGYGERVYPASGLEGRTAADAAVRTLRPREEGAEPGGALAYARRRLEGHARAELWVITDDAAAVERAPRPPGPSGGPAVHVVPVGRPLDNLALVHLTLARQPADPTEVAVRATVQSWSAGERRVTVELRDGAGGRVLARPQGLVGARGRAELRATFRALGERLVEAVLVPAGSDALALDDRAFAVLPPAGRRRVLLVGETDLYLQAALLGLGPGVAVERIPAAAVGARRTAFPAYDAVVFDGVTPDPAPGEGRFLYLDPAGPGNPFAEGGRIRDPIPTAARRDHPLLAHVSLADLNIAQARRLSAGPGDEVVVTAVDAALVIARQRPGLRLVALSFDPRRSDLPLRPAFPLLLGNALDWLAQGRRAGDDDGGSQAAGTYARVALPPEAIGAVVVDPTGARGRRPAAGGWLGLPLPVSGFYRITPEPARGPARVLAASFLHPLESDTRRAATAPPSSAARPTPGWWRAGDLATVALLLAFCLCLLEWLGHQRRWIS